MKIFRAFGPFLGKTKLSKAIIVKINKQVDKSILSKKNDYSHKLVSQVKNQTELSNKIIKKKLSNELIQNIKKYLFKSNLKNIKDISPQSLGC